MSTKLTFNPSRLLAGLGAVVALVAVTAGPALAQSAAESAAVDELTVVSAIILGLVEGLTEYLPVSSTGHLLVTNKILGLGQTEAAENALETYAICIQAGAILAVLVMYRERVAQMVDGVLGRSAEGRQVVFSVAAAFIPTAIIGLAIVGPVREYLFGIVPIAIAWLVGGFGILFLTRSGVMNREGMLLEQLSVRQAVLIGIAQAIAMWPGTSRSLVTIVAAVLVGLSLRAAVEFAFLLGLVTLSAATAATAVTGGAELIELYGWVNPLIGLVVAFVSALASVAWMVSWLENRSFNVFGYYRIAIGLAAFAAVGLGWL